MSPILSDILTACAALIASGITALAGILVADVRHHISLTKLIKAEKIGTSAVKAVEGLAVAEGWNPQQKYQQALAQAERLAAAHGVRLSASQWSTLIEQAVTEMKEVGGELTAPTPPAAPTLDVAAIKRQAVQEVLRSLQSSLEGGGGNPAPASATASPTAATVPTNPIVTTSGS